MAERAGLESLILEVAGSKPTRRKVLLIRGLFLCFLIHFIKLFFFCVVASVCEAQPRRCVNYLDEFSSVFFPISDLSCVNYDLLVFS